MSAVMFAVYDMNGDGAVTNGELFYALKLIIGSSLEDVQLQQVVDKTLLNADKNLTFEMFESVCIICNT